jgi:hypothetical protein
MGIRTMPVYRIYRIKESPRQQFRWAPHVCGATSVRLRDYEEGETIEAASVYAAWSALRDSPSALRVGDLLATADGGLRIVKYVGFEEARWAVPETHPPAAAATAPAGSGVR